MSTIALTTFLKIISLNTTNSQIAEIDRLFSGSEGGYDYYRELKRVVPKIAKGDLTSKDVGEDLKRLSKPHERRDNVAGSKTFEKWWTKADRVFVPPPKTDIFGNDRQLIRIRIKPEIAYEEDGVLHVMQLWNTARPDLTTTIAGIGVDLMRRRLAKGKFSGAKFEVFDMRKNKIRTEANIPNNSEIILRSEIAKLSSIAESL